MQVLYGSDSAEEYYGTSLHNMELYCPASYLGTLSWGHIGSGETQGRRSFSNTPSRGSNRILAQRQQIDGWQVKGADILKRKWYPAGFNIPKVNCRYPRPPTRSSRRLQYRLGSIPLGVSKTSKLFVTNQASTHLAKQGRRLHYCRPGTRPGCRYDRLIIAVSTGGWLSVGSV